MKCGRPKGSMGGRLGGLGGFDYIWGRPDGVLALVLVSEAKNPHIERR